MNLELGKLFYVMHCIAGFIAGFISGILLLPGYSALALLAFLYSFTSALSLSVIVRKKGAKLPMSKVYREGLFTTLAIFIAVWVVSYNLAGAHPVIVKVDVKVKEPQILKWTSGEMLLPNENISYGYNSCYITKKYPNGSFKLILGRYYEPAVGMFEFVNPINGEMLICNVSSLSFTPVSILNTCRSGFLWGLFNITADVEEDTAIVSLRCADSEISERIAVGSTKSFYIEKLDVTLKIEVLELDGNCTLLKIYGEEFSGATVNLSMGKINYDVADLVVFQEGKIYVFYSEPYNIKDVLKIDGAYLVIES
ncbi:MAG: hypothetical protein DRN81_01395 [Thermoproteota archaeon]|nr:MAG: hypothetical protein DRN81_01395 [Candidatus Korarchaeota archaeon]